MNLDEPAVLAVGLAAAPSGQDYTIRYVALAYTVVPSSPRPPRSWRTSLRPPKAQYSLARALIAIDFLTGAIMAACS